MKYFFLRNDDVCRLDGKLRAFFEACRGLKTVSAVIPSRLTRECAEFLKSQPTDVVQHGHRHRRDRPEDLARGMAVMNARFGRRWVKAYVPPFHRLDVPTIQSLAALGFKAVSAGADSSPISFLAGSDLLGLPVRMGLDFEMNKRGASLETIRKFVEKNSPRHAVFGIVVHHRKIRDMEAFRRVIGFLKDHAEKVGARAIGFKGALRLLSLPSIGARRKARELIRRRFASHGPLGSDDFLGRIGDFHRLGPRGG
ncbi:MAG TPA: hypothetical protein VNI01_04190 [Elusimicrobiota bacterium]|jgi:hypothetical protein|nr:hypothetical protein [Elusimicrobiota bacterium]